MRVIAGNARRHVLTTPEGLDVRPTTDRTKETLFNMIQNKVMDCIFLDLFSGSGAIGIEALSRGASHAVFVDNNQQALGCIKTNLEHTKLIDQGTILKKDVKDAINLLSKQEKQFDIIFLDPPYNKGWEEKIIMLILENQLLKDDGLLICESSIDTKFDFLQDTSATVLREKAFRTNKFTLINV